MDKVLIEAIYELTQAIEVLALKVDELDQTNSMLLQQNADMKDLYLKLNALIENIRVS